MTVTRKLIVGGALAVLLAGPAAAQGQDRFEMFGPGERGWFEGRPEVFGEGRRGWFEERDRYVRDEYERGYRMGRDDERRVRDQEARRGYDTAMRLLDEARRRIEEGELREAWIALGRAETRLLTRATSAPQGEQAAAGGAIGAIRDARQALQDRRPGYARDRIARAEALVERGRVIGSRVSGDDLAGAGTPGPSGFMGGGGR